jgi:hypothetical protein
MNHRGREKVFRAYRPKAMESFSMEHKGDDENKYWSTGPARDVKNQFLKAFVLLVVLVGWIWVVNWLLLRYEGMSYFKWFLKNGSFISAATAVFALTSNRFEDKGLLSLNPLFFFGSCLSTAALFCLALAENLEPRRAESAWDNAAELGKRSIIEAIWDGVFGVIINLFMFVLMLAWLLMVAPAFYFLTMFTGAPARIDLRGGGRKLFVRRAGNVTAITIQPSTTAVPKETMDISLGSQPFALTNAVNAIVIGIVASLLTKAG